MRHFLLAILAAALLAGCSSGSKPPETKKPEAAAKETRPSELATGRMAFQRLYATARMWAPDAQPFRLESEPSKDAPGTDGKSGIWRGYFASPAKRSLKPYLWSGLSGPDAPERGVNPGTEDTFNPANASTQPFDFAFLKVDSDKALETAEAHGGKKLLEKDPKLPIKYTLDWNRASHELVWHVIYGGDEARLRVAVDASTGDFLRVEK